MNVLNAELKPCPFCGGEARLESYHDMDGDIMIYARCDECRSATVQVAVSDSGGDAPLEDMLETVQKVIDLWNRRDD